MEWIRRMLEKRALRNVNRGTLQLPADLRYIEKSVLLWPSNPDDAAIEIGRKMLETLGDKIALAIGYADSCPFKKIEYMKLDEKNETGLFGYPKKTAAGKINDFSASIDLSPKFDLKLSGLPALARIPLRIGRDTNKMGSFYNVMLTGNSGNEVQTLIGAMKN